MLKERNISEEWVQRVLDHPDWEKAASEDTVYYSSAYTNARIGFSGSS